MGNLRGRGNAGTREWGITEGDELGSRAVKPTDSASIHPDPGTGSIRINEGDELGSRALLFGNAETKRLIIEPGHRVNTF